MNKISKVIVSILVVSTFMLNSVVAFADNNDLENLRNEDLGNVARSTEVKANTDGISYGALLKITDIEILYNKVNKFIEKNPDATEDDINIFLKKEMKKKYLSGKKQIDSSSSNEMVTLSYYSPTDLNPLEQALYDQNPWKGLQALWEGNKAVNEAQERYNGSLHNDNGDAFRHAYWNAMMVKHIDYSWAYDWATAHEEGAEGQPAIEGKMDLYNNMMGRLIGNANKSKSDEEIADIIQEAVRNGEMKIIANGNLVPTNSKGEK